MDFSFLHTADLHLGSPFLGLSSTDEELARLVSSASREAFEELVAQAIERQVNFVVIAGDVYDGDWKDTTIGHFFNRQMGRLARAGIPVFQVRGNHDAESVITGAVTLPPTVHSFSSKKAETFRIADLKVALHGQSFANRAITENLALKYPQPNPGWFNIGVLHTSCDGRPGHAVYAPCSVQDLLQRGYQYWALGHVHAYEELHADPPIIFPGNLQGRSIRECGPKGAVLVEVQDGEVSGYSRLHLDRIRWALISADLTGINTETEAFKTIREAIQEEVDHANGTPVVFRMVLSGSTLLHRKLHSEPERLADEILAAANHCTDSIWLESVRVQTSELSFPTAGHDSPLSALDLRTMLVSLRESPQVLQEGRAALDLIKGKLPAMDIPEDLFSDEGILRLIDEARELLVSSRLTTGEDIA